MIWVILIVLLVISGWGLYLAGDFVYWRLRGVIVLAEVTGFQDKKSKGRRLPLAEFEKLQFAPGRIDQFLYLLSPPSEGKFTDIIYLKHKPEKARVYGIFNLVFGLILCAPLFLILASAIGNTAMALQLLYIVIFVLMVVTGWVVLKFIQRNY